MELVTGRAGSDHISSADLAAMYRGLLVADDVVLAEGDQLSCTMLNANTAQIGTGSCMLQAHHARVEAAEQVTIDSGSPGYKRNDLIVARYTLGDGNIQAVYLDVIKGTAVAGTASDPAYTDGDIDGGDTLVEFPLWRIPIDGVNVGTPVRIMPLTSTLQAQVDANASAITALGESVYQGSMVDVFYSVGSVAANSYKTVSVDLSSYWPFLYYGANLNTVACGITSASVDDTKACGVQIRNFTSSAASPNLHIMLKRL